MYIQPCHASMEEKHCMKIGIDARKICDFGIGAYIRNLIRYIPECDSEHEYLIFHYPGEEQHIPQTGGTQFRCVPEGSPKYSLRELTLLPLNLWRHHLDLFHAPHYTLPPLRSCKAVVTIHDVIHLRFPEYLPHRAAYYYAKSLMWMAAGSASKVLTVSHCSKQDLITFLNIPAEKIEVIYNGIEQADAPSSSRRPCQTVFEHFKIPRPYLLYLGNFLPHKNLETLIRAYSLVKHRFHISHCLVLAGKNERLREMLQKRIRQEGLEQDVILTGFVEDAWKSSLYACADLFIYPSLYEGFGLQALEAMAHQIPVVITNIPALTEIAGDAAVRCDPHSPASMADAMLAVLSDQALQQSLIEKGNSCIRAFSWRAMAQRTVEIYHAVLRES